MSATISSHTSSQPSSGTSLMTMVIERHPNPDITTYHINLKLSGVDESLTFRHKDGKVLPAHLTFIDDLTDIDPNIQAFAERLYAIPGISGDGFMSSCGITMSTYSIEISKAKAFSDDEIESQVEAVIADAFGLELSDVDKRIIPRSPRLEFTLETEFA